MVVLKITVPAGMLVSASRWVVLMRTQAWDVVEKVEESERNAEFAKLEESERSDEVAVVAVWALPAVLEKVEESDFEEYWAEIALWAELAVWAEVA